MKPEPTRVEESLISAFPSSAEKDPLNPKADTLFRAHRCLCKQFWTALATLGTNHASHNRSWWKKERGRAEQRGNRRALFAVAADHERGDRKGEVRRRSASANDSKTEAAGGG